MTRTRRFFIHGGALTIACLLVYVLLAPPHVVDGDNAEFSTLGALGGRAHPTGYPSYVLYLRAMSWLPGASPAHTAALATALLSGALVLVLHAACRAWGARPVAAGVAVALYAGSPVVLRMHVEAEVFAPNALVVALVLWLSATKGPLRGAWRTSVLGLVAGLGLSNHVTCVLVAPVGLLGAVRGVREASASRVIAVAAGTGGLLLGLSTYLYLFLADGSVSYGRVDTFSDLLHFFLRMDYGGPGAFLPGGKEPNVPANLLALAETLGRGWFWLPGLVGLVALAARAVRSDTGEPRSGWITLSLSWLVAGPVIALRFNIDPEGLGLYVSQRFHLLPLVLLVIPVAVGLDGAGSFLGRYVGQRLRGETLLTCFSVLVFLAAMTSSLPRVRAVHSPAMELAVHNMLESAPANALVIANSDDLCMGADYVQHVLGRRPDVVVACWTLTARQWYRDRLARRGVRIELGFTHEMTQKQAEAFLATGRPLLVDRSQKAIRDQLPSYPHGFLIRLLAPGEKPPPVHEVVELNRRLYASFDLDYPHPGRADDYAAVAHRRYAGTWVVLSDALERVGDQAGADAAMEIAAKLAPTK